MKQNVQKFTPITKAVRATQHQNTPELKKTNKLAGGIAIIIGLVLAAQLFIGQQPAKETLASLQTIPEEGTDMSTCETSDDCILVKTECCACDQGGTKTAINRKYYSHWLTSKRDQCIFASCQNILSDDLSCQKSAKPKCVQNTCQVK